MKLRYVLVFVIGVACMYWLVRSGLVTINPIGQENNPSTSGNIQIDSYEDLNPTITGAIVTGSQSTGELVTSGVQNDNISGDTTALDTTVAIMQWSGIETPTTSSTNTNNSEITKDQACKWWDGNFETSLQVGRNDASTARTSGYGKLRNFLHYIVFVSDGSKYYFYHNCANGVATNVQNITNTADTKIIISNGQVYLQ